MRATPIPALDELDSTIAFLRDGYLFGIRRYERVHDDAFRTRILGRPVVVARGIEAARFFFEDGRFERGGAVPSPASHRLPVVGGLATAERAEHERRSRRLLAITTDPDTRAALVAEFRAQWRSAITRVDGHETALHDIAAEVLSRSAIRWAGIAESGPVLAMRSRELRSMSEMSGRLGPLDVGSRVRRQRAERWATELFDLARTDVHTPISAWVQGLENEEGLTPSAAAGQFLDVLRPIVAVGRFVVFAALALHRHPIWLERLREEPETLPWFANEVRRFYPFVPVVGGVAARDLEWRGERWPRGSWFLLDLYGTDHSTGLWYGPGRFDPARHSRPIDRNAFIAQGGGHYGADHRCPGEPMTVDLIVAALESLIDRPRFVPSADQDLRVSLRRFPTGPNDGLRGTFV